MGRRPVASTSVGRAEGWWDAHQARRRSPLRRKAHRARAVSGVWSSMSRRG